ncbi:sigma-70 family RNA polymerase sigma factor [Streptomyces sp. NBC_00829]|uniref:sigma-70 family RNA polymerase sigma factor n=1 Tax=Streptomyces sp. NBC_00829 TaxID=2903679 RepID=UPI0038661CF0|nr:sigma-70 family RNA polymerase sigma factor [Streptomyces sp. NBC_00829]
MPEQANRPIGPPGGPEPALVARARAGDREAFAALYREHHRLVYRFLFFRTRNRHLAEDLTQEVFVRALRRMSSFAWQGSEFAAWLLTIARNLHLDDTRHSRTRLETLVAEFQETGLCDRSAESSALRRLEAIDAHEAVRSALRTLNPYQRHCVELRFINGLSAEETAHEMGRSVAAVKTLTFRAMQRLRSHAVRVAG